MAKLLKLKALLIKLLALLTLLQQQQHLGGITPSTIPQISSSWSIQTDLNSDATLNNYLDSLTTLLSNQENSYQASNGKYLQELATNTVLPVYGNLIAPNNLSVKPYYQSENWFTIVNFGTVTLPVNIEITQYENSLKQRGYQIIYKLIKDGQIYTKTYGYGVEAAQRTMNWHLEKQ